MSNGRHRISFLGIISIVVILAILAIFLIPAISHYYKENKEKEEHNKNYCVNICNDSNFTIKNNTCFCSDGKEYSITD